MGDSKNKVTSMLASHDEKVYKTAMDVTTMLSRSGLSQIEIIAVIAKVLQGLSDYMSLMTDVVMKSEKEQVDIVVDLFKAALENEDD